jgi:hypothetical protein
VPAHRIGHLVRLLEQVGQKGLRRLSRVPVTVVTKVADEREGPSEPVVRVDSPFQVASFVAVRPA